MFNRKKNKTSLQNRQEVKQDFKGYVKNVIYRSEEYHKIMTRKGFYCLDGYKSHPTYIDLMIKEGKAYYIGEHRGIIPLSFSVKDDSI